MTPINRRRLAQFRANRRGYVAYRSDFKFGGGAVRHDFSQHANKVRLEKWLPTMEHRRHLAFLGGGQAIANILFETADLLEIDGQDSFRIRSYRNAAQAIEQAAAGVSALWSGTYKGSRMSFAADVWPGDALALVRHGLFEAGLVHVQATAAADDAGRESARPGNAGLRTRSRSCAETARCRSRRGHSQRGPVRP